jgi:hypothetical protein
MNKALLPAKPLAIPGENRLQNRLQYRGRTGEKPWEVKTPHTPRALALALTLVRRTTWRQLGSAIGIPMLALGSILGALTKSYLRSLQSFSRLVSQYAAAPTSIIEWATLAVLFTVHAAGTAIPATEAHAHRSVLFPVRVGAPSPSTHHERHIP